MAVKARMKNGAKSMKGAAKDAFKSGLGHLATGSGCLQMFHFFLAFITVIGLNMTDISYDLHQYQKKFEDGGDLLNELCKNTKEESAGYFFQCRFYCFGAVWSILIGLFGLISMIVLAANIIIPMPKKLMVVYYFVSCFVIFLIALIGVCFNLPVESYINCLSKQQVMAPPVDPNPWRPDNPDPEYQEEDNRNRGNQQSEICAYRNFYQAGVTVPAQYYFFMFTLTCVHAILYFFSGVIEVAKPSENAPRLSQDSAQYIQDQQAQPQEEQQQWTQEQLQQYAQSQPQQPQQWAQQ